MNGGHISVSTTDYVRAPSRSDRISSLLRASQYSSRMISAAASAAAATMAVAGASSCKRRRADHLLLRPIATALLLSSSSSSSLSTSPAPFVRRSVSPSTRTRSFLLTSFKPHPYPVNRQLVKDLRGGAAPSSSITFSPSMVRLRSTAANTDTAATREKKGATETESQPEPKDARMTPAERLSALRQRMSELNLDIYVVPSDDPHLSGKLQHFCPLNARALLGVKIGRCICFSRRVFALRFLMSSLLLPPRRRIIL